MTYIFSKETKTFINLNKIDEIKPMQGGTCALLKDGEWLCEIPNEELEEKLGHSVSYVWPDYSTMDYKKKDVSSFDRLRKPLKDKRGRAYVFSYKLPVKNHYGENLQYIPTCPYCGGSHNHGISDNDHGIRLSHCDNAEYQLILLENTPKQILNHYKKWAGEDE